MPCKLRNFYFYILNKIFLAGRVNLTRLRRPSCALKNKTKRCLRKHGKSGVRPEYAPGIPDYDDRSKRNCMRLHSAGVDVVLPSTHTPEDESMCRALLNVTRIIEE